MRMKGVLFLVLLGFLASSLWAQPHQMAPSVDPTDMSIIESNIQANITDGQKTADSLERQSELLSVLLVVIAVLGAVTSLLHGLGHFKSKKTLGIVLGALIPILTYVTTNNFPADFRTLQKTSITCKGFIMDARSDYAQYLQETDPDNKAQMLLAVHEDLSKVTSQYSDLYQKTASSRFGLVDSAWADTVTPTWCSNPPQADAYYYYFVGSGSNSSVAAARNLALEEANAKAIHLAVSVFKNAQVQSFFDYNIKPLLAVVKTSIQKQGTLYTVYVLLKLPKSAI